jgi:hypothetical protein
MEASPLIGISPPKIPPPIGMVLVSQAPSGTCTAFAPMQFVTETGQIYYCNLSPESAVGAWSEVRSGTLVYPSVRVGCHPPLYSMPTLLVIAALIAMVGILVGILAQKHAA